MPLTIEQMVRKMGLPEQLPAEPTLRSTKELASLRQNLPGAFNEIHELLEKYPATKEMKPKEMESMVSSIIKKHLIVEQNFNAAQGACQALRGISTLAGSPKLVKACNLTSQAITFTQNLMKVNEILKTPNLNMTELLTSGLAGGPVGMLCTAAFTAFSIMGGFNDSPSIEQVMLEQLQAISEQINTLRKEMHEGFINIHQQLDAVQEQIFKSTQRISDEITAFRNEMNQNIDSLARYLEQSFDKVHAGQRHVALQDLRTLVALVDAGTNDNNKQDILNMHENFVSNWLSSQIGSPIFNGSDLFKAGNTIAAHESDLKNLKSNDPQILANTLGYIAHIAQEMDPEYARTYNPITVVNPYVFKFAASKLITLYSKYPAILKDHEAGLTQTIEVCNNTLDVFTNINTRTEIWDNLINNYVQGMKKVDFAIKMQTAKANSEFRSTQPEGVKFDISDKLEDSLEKSKAGPIAQSIAKCQQPFFNDLEVYEEINMEMKVTRKNVPIPDLDINTFKLPKWPMQPELILASYFKLCEIKPSYDFVFKMNGNHPHHSPLHVLIKKETPDAIAYQITFEMNVPFLAHKFKHIWETVISGDYSNANSMDLISMICGHPRYPSLAILPETDYQLMRAPTTNPKRLETLKLEAFQGFVLRNEGRFNYLKVTGYNLAKYIENDPNINITWKLHNELRKKILELRKTKVVFPLINGDVTELKPALEHFDSARYRLLAFAGMANISPELIAQIQMLPTSDDIKNKLRNYHDTAAIDTAIELVIPMWELPDISNIAELKAQILNEVTLKANGVHVPTLPEQALQKTKNELLECKNLFLPGYRASKHGSSVIELQKIGLDLVALDATTKDTNRRIHFLIVNCILKHDLYGLNLHIQDYQELQTSMLYINANCRLTALHVAAYLGNYEEINAFSTLFEKLLNRQDTDGKTPLMYAVAANNIATVRALLENGADRTITNREGQTALNLTTNAEILELLRVPVQGARLRA